MFVSIPVSLVLYTTKNSMRSDQMRCKPLLWDYNWYKCLLFCVPKLVMLGNNQLLLNKTKKFVFKESKVRSNFFKSVTKYLQIANTAGQFYLFKITVLHALKRCHLRCINHCLDSVRLIRPWSICLCRPCVGRTVLMKRKFSFR